jgi:hypothetical protein
MNMPRKLNATNKTFLVGVVYEYSPRSTFRAWLLGKYFPIVVRNCRHGMTAVLTERTTLRVKNMVWGDTAKGGVILKYWPSKSYVCQYVVHEINNCQFLSLDMRKSGSVFRILHSRKQRLEIPRYNGVWICIYVPTFRWSLLFAPSGWSVFGI